MNNNNVYKKYYRLGVLMKLRGSKTVPNYDGEDFAHDLSKNKSTKNISIQKMREGSPDVIKYWRYINVNVKRTNHIGTISVPLIVELCDNGVMDVISGTKFNICDENICSLLDARFQPVDPSFIENVITHLSDKQIDEYREKTKALSSFIDSYIEKQRRIKLHQNNIIAARENKEIKSSIFIRTYQEKHGISASK